MFRRFPGAYFADVSTGCYSHHFVRRGNSRVLINGEDVTNRCYGFESIGGIGRAFLHKVNKYGTPYLSCRFPICASGTCYWGAIACEADIAREIKYGLIKVKITQEGV